MIRKANKEDMPKMIKMALAFFDETYYKRFANLSKDYAEEILAALIDGGILLVDEEVNGMIGLNVGDFIFDPKVKTAAEIFWYVSPASQNSGLGSKLLDSAISACTPMGVKQLQMIDLVKSPWRARAMYESRGLVHQENTYMMRIK